MPPLSSLPIADACENRWLGGGICPCAAKAVASHRIPRSHRVTHRCHGQLAARARRCYAPILRWQSWDCNRQALDYRQCQILVPALGSIEPAISDLHGLEPPRRRHGQQAARGTLRRYMAHLEDCIVNDKRPGEDAREGTKTIAALDAAWRSAKSGLPQKVVVRW